MAYVNYNREMERETLMSKRANTSSLWFAIIFLNAASLAWWAHTDTWLHATMPIMFISTFFCLRELKNDHKTFLRPMNAAAAAITLAAIILFFVR